VADSSEDGPNRLAFKAAAIARGPLCAVELPETLLNEIVALLEVDQDKWAPILRRMLPLQARSYLNVKAILSADSPHRSRKAVARLADGLTDALGAMEDIGIEQAFALTVLLDRAEGPHASKSLIEIRRVLEGVRDVAAAWVEMYQPRDRRPKNRALELHVGALMYLFEQATGNRATASLKRTGSHEPRLTSREAKAIHLLLKAVDRDATETAIANKIVAIGRESKGKSLERYAPGLLVGASVYPTR
jgi:hypothetical protein